MKRREVGDRGQVQIDEDKKQGRVIKKFVHIKDGIGNLIPCILIFKIKFKKKMLRNK